MRQTPIPTFTLGITPDAQGAQMPPGSRCIAFAPREKRLHEVATECSRHFENGRRRRCPERDQRKISRWRSFWNWNACMLLTAIVFQRPSHTSTVTADAMPSPVCPGAPPRAPAPEGPEGPERIPAPNARRNLLDAFNMAVNVPDVHLLVGLVRTRRPSVPAPSTPGASEAGRAFGSPISATSR